VLALGASFSALEVVRLVLIGLEAYENLTLSRARLWLSAYRWPTYFFVAVAFWNYPGAGPDAPMAVAQPAKSDMPARLAVREAAVSARVLAAPLTSMIPTST
jgi:hypothetical protein